MKNYYRALVFIVSGLFLVASAGAADLEQGFMGYQWGDDIRHYPGLKQLYQKGGITFYANPGESYRVEDVTIGDVIYGFYQGTFYAVYININDPGTFDLIQRHLESRYGEPASKASAEDDLLISRWNYKDVTIKLKTDSRKKFMKVAFYYGPTSRTLKQARMLEMIETSDRFFPIEKNKEINMVPFLESWNMR